MTPEVIVSHIPPWQKLVEVMVIGALVDVTTTTPPALVIVMVDGGTTVVLVVGGPVVVVVGRTVVVGTIKVVRVVYGARPSQTWPAGQHAGVPSRFAQ